MKRINRKKQIVYINNNRVIIKKEEGYFLPSILAAIFSNETVLAVINKEVSNNNKIGQYDLSSLQNQYGDKYEVNCNGKKYDFKDFLNVDLDIDLIELYFIWKYYMEEITKRGNLRACINNLKKYRGTKILFKDFK